jgi:hypothetical protein
VRSGRSWQAGHVRVWVVQVRRVAAWQGMAGRAMHGRDRHGAVGWGKSGYGMAGRVPHGRDRLCKARLGTVGQARCGESGKGLARPVWVG